MARTAYIIVKNVFLHNNVNIIRMKNIFSALLLTILFVSVGDLYGQGKAERNHIEPLELATLLESPDAGNTLILNTGPVNDIKGATNIGAVSEAKNLKKLRKLLRKQPKDKEIIIYCGCCPLASCPNIQPAYDMLEEMSFTNYKVLRLDEDLKVDWIDKGYPMAN